MTVFGQESYFIIKKGGEPYEKNNQIIDLAKGFLLLSDIYAKQGKTADAIDYLQSLRTNYPGKEKEIFDAIDSRLKSLGKGKANAGKSAASSDNSKKSGKKK